MTATTRTGAKCRAASEKYEAEPPKAASASPLGVWMSSRATEPTTKMGLDTKTSYIDVGASIAISPSAEDSTRRVAWHSASRACASSKSSWMTRCS